MITTNDDIPSNYVYALTIPGVSMNITDFTPKLSAKRLNESAYRHFGQSLDVDNMTLEDLYDARNKLRTMLHHFSGTGNFKEIHESEKYHKAKMFVDVLNRAINERSEFLNLSESEKRTLNMVAEGTLDPEYVPKTLVEKTKKKLSKADKNYISSDKPIPLKKKNKKTQKLVEGEEEKAALIMQTRDMVNRITGWMENCASMQAEQMLDLTDSIRYELGAETASKFEQIVKPALNEIYAALENNRKKMTVGISMLTGEEHAMMGEIPQPNQQSGANLGSDAPDGQQPPVPQDDFGASQAASSQGTIGRETRESREYKRKK